MNQSYIYLFITPFKKKAIIIANALFLINVAYKDLISIV
jgi:hypothetical protein